MCDVLGWNRSGYYAWHHNREARREKADAEEDLARRIRAIHTDSRGAYGACRITQKLRSQGHAVNRERVARIMRERETVGITRRKPRSLTKQDRTAPPMPDLVQREFTAPMPGLKFVGDFTCSPTAEGWLYLATVIDLCTREVVGWPIAGLRGRTYSGQRDLPFRPRIAI
jgi:transposase InsO family protein